MRLDHAGTIDSGTGEVGASELVGAHKTSMRQDIEAGRSPEIEVWQSLEAEPGHLTDTPTLHIDIMHVMVKLLASTIQRTP